MTIDFRDIAHTVPRKGFYVYELLGADGAVYIGQSQAPRDRVRAHSRRAEWWPLVTEVNTYGPYDTADTARDVERAMIREAQPPHNLMHTDRWQPKHYPPKPEPEIDRLRRELAEARGAVRVAQHRLDRALHLARLRVPA